MQLLANYGVGIGVYVLKVLCQSYVWPHCANPNDSIHTLYSVLKCTQYMKPETLNPWLTTETGDW